MLTKLLAALMFLIGIGSAGWSLTSNLMTGEHLATLAVAAFVFAGAIGVWDIADRVEQYFKDK